MTQAHRALRVTHVIGSLDVGGAETALVKLVLRSVANGLRHEVISLLKDMPLADGLEGAGVPVRTLGLDRKNLSFAALAHLREALIDTHTDVVQTWMYHGDLFGGLAARAADIPILWNIRQGSYPGDEMGWRTRIAAMACALVSRWVPDVILGCSERGLALHRKRGYRGIMEYIPNGFETERFLPAPDGGRDERERLAVSGEDFVIGMAARFCPQKDHATFFTATRRFLARHPEALFMLCGEGVRWDNERLSRLIPDDLAFRSHLRLLGVCRDMTGFYPALDLCTLSSVNEGMPNVLGEAMACAIPCVATDVGDTALLMGDTGIAVPPGDPDRLEEGWEALYAMGPEGRRALGKRCRDRIEKQFSMELFVNRYEAVWRRCARQDRGGATLERA